MNTTSITGRLTADPELRATQNGTSVCSFTLAVKRPKVKDMTDFINCVVWRAGAEYLCKYGHKGDTVAANGILTTRKYQDRDGNNRTAFEVVADTVELIGGQRTESRNDVNISAQQDYEVLDGDLAGQPLPF